MKLDLKRIAREPGSTLPFAFQMDLSQLEWNGEHPVSQPVTVEGSVRNMAGALLLRASLTGTLSLACDLKRRRDCLDLDDLRKRDIFQICRRMECLLDRSSRDLITLLLQ